MSILPSADTARLIAELDSADALRRETAAARLSVIGGRAVTRLLALAGDASAAVHARLAALGALEAIGDSRAYALAKTLAEGADVRLAVAAISVLGVLAEGDGPHADKAFDKLTGLALDAAIDSDRRVAACQALEGQPANVVKPILDALSHETAAPVQAHATRAQAGATEPIDSLEDADLPSDPAVLLAIVREEGADARVTLLRVLIDRVREKERAVRTASAREHWTAARGLLHQHLAAKNSRLAVYDLRETLEAAAAAKSAAPLPVGFLAAAAAVGDTACLEPIAGCWMNAPDDKWWRDHLAEAFAAIVKREKITRKHPAIKRIAQKWPAAALLIAAAKA
jgi:hypothetical protein